MHRTIKDRLLQEPKHLELLAAGCSISSVARGMDCSAAAIRDALRQIGGYTPRPMADPGLFDVPPSPEEDEISKNSLSLAPSVAVIAERVKQETLAAYLTGEKLMCDRQTYWRGFDER